MNKPVLVSLSLIIALLILSHGVSFAQDKIYFHNGNFIEAFIISVKDNTIKAYISDDTSTQTISTENVHKIVYENGKILILSKDNTSDDQTKIYKEESKEQINRSRNQIEEIKQEPIRSSVENPDIRFGTIVQTEAPSGSELQHQEEKRENEKTANQSPCLFFTDKRIQKKLIGHYERENMYTNKDRRGILESAIELLNEKLNKTTICDKYSNFSKIEIEILELNYIWDDNSGSFVAMKGRTVTEINVIYYLNNFPIKNEIFSGSTDLHKLKLNNQLLMFENSIEDLIRKMGL